VDVASVFDEQGPGLSCGQGVGFEGVHPLGRRGCLAAHMGVVAVPSVEAANFACRQDVVSSHAVEDLPGEVVVVVPEYEEVLVDQDLGELPIVLVVHLVRLQVPGSGEVACLEVSERHFDHLAHHLGHCGAIAIEP
jgi:hypothetical protein